MKEQAVTLLWLGSEARLADPDGRPGRSFPVRPEEPAAALVRQLAEEFPGAGAVRILYQPAALAIEAMAPSESPGRRPDLRRRGCVWSLEGNPAGLGEGLLSSEANSPLPTLVRCLEDQGLRVEGAWPLAALLELMPRSAEDGPAGLRLVIAGGWALLWSADPLGRRRLRLHPLEAAEEMVAELRALLVTFDEQRTAPAWMALDDDAWPPGVRSAIRELIPAEIPLPALLAQARRLPAGGPSDFLRPDGRRFRLGRPLALGICFVLGLAALVASWRVHEAASARQRQRGFRAAATAAARDAELASARKLDQLNRELAQAVPRRCRLDLLLLALARAIPPEIRLREIASHGPDFLIRGRILGPEETAGSSLAKFRQDLAADPAAWSWTETPPPTGGAFLWRGSFRADPPVPVRTPEEGAARLTQARALWPSREKAESAMGVLTRDWTGGPAGPPDGAGRQSYQFSLARRPLAAWSDIVANVQALAAEPGFTLDGFELEAAEESGEAFTQGRLELSVLARE